MPRWSKNSKKFIVVVTDTKKHGIRINLPAPIYSLLNNPEKIMFIVGNKKTITIKKSIDQSDQ